jgi:hypothetical protein
MDVVISSVSPRQLVVTCNLDEKDGDVAKQLWLRGVYRLIYRNVDVGHWWQIMSHVGQSLNIVTSATRLGNKQEIIEQLGS